MNLLLPSAYFPPISYFACLLNGRVTIEAHEHFVKQSIRTRCLILGANGPLHLLVPRSGSEGRQTVNEVQIHEETDWRTLHWRSLESAYRKSPYFEYYEDDLRPFFEASESNLFALNLSSISLVCSLLEMPFEATLSTAYDKQFDGLDMRSAWDKAAYSSNGPVIEFPTYIQVFSDRHAFVPDLSILDLLFCLGPRSVEYLEGLQLNLRP